MKKVSAIFWAILFFVALFILLMQNANAEAIAAPEIFQESKGDGIRIEVVARVSFDWESIYRLDEIEALIYQEYADKIIAVFLTDGAALAHANIMEQIKPGALAVSFDTAPIRKFVTRYAYLIIVKSTAE